MKKYGTLLFVLILAALYLVFPAVAQEEAAGPETFAGSLTLWLAIIIGFVAAIATGVFAYQLKGGVVGSALTFFAAGMFLVVLGFLAVVVSWTEASTQAIVHDILFIIGYILMLVGALRLRQMLR